MVEECRYFNIHLITTTEGWKFCGENRNEILIVKGWGSGMAGHISLSWQSGGGKRNKVSPFTSNYLLKHIHWAPCVMTDTEHKIARHPFLNIMILDIH
jgi:hypothetical protein